MAQGGTTIFGRDEERAALARFIDETATRFGALVFEGVAGIGKSTLWSEAIARVVPASSVLASRPSEGDASFGFAALSDLLAGHWSAFVDHLPGPQRRALGNALLVEEPNDGSRTDARAVAIATTEAIRLLAGRHPITIALDDVQWIDPSSAKAIAFALRRLQDAPVRVICAVREDDAATAPLGLADALGDHLRRIRLGPLDARVLRRVVEHRTGASIGPVLTRRIHDATNGNPFFACQIARALPQGQSSISDGPLPVPADLDALLRSRLRRLSRSAQDSLEVVAAATSPTLQLVLAAGATESGLEEAEEAGIIVVAEGTVGFTHPLLASAVLSSTSVRRRGEVHERLAVTSPSEEERARHQGLSIDAPDEGAARSLERAALLAQARGATAAAAELNELAARKTPPELVDAVSRRRHRALGNLFAAGDVGPARSLCERWIEQARPGTERSRDLYSLSCMTWGDIARSTSLLERALDEVGPATALEAAIRSEMAWNVIASLNPREAIAWSESALAAETDDQSRWFGNPDAPWSTHLTALAARAIAGCLLGEDTLAVLQEAWARQDAIDYSDTGTLGFALGTQHLWLGRYEDARGILEGEIRRFEEVGHVYTSWELRTALATVELRSGHVNLAAHHVGIAESLVEDAGWLEALAEIRPVQAMIHAYRGDLAQARAAADDGLSRSERQKDTWNAIQARSALAFVQLSQGSHAEALRWLRPNIEVTETAALQEPGAFPFHGDAIEALIRVGEVDQAVQLIQWLEHAGTTRVRPTASATAARGRALLAAIDRDEQTTQTSLEEAMQHLAAVEDPFEHGRTLLIRGQIERRFKRRLAARGSLEAAIARFDDVGTELWSQRAKDEMNRLGRVVPTGSLTRTEEQVARLIVEGRTNREIAIALFLSVKTVEANVTSILRKLRVGSRRDVAGGLQQLLERDPRGGR